VGPLTAGKILRLARMRDVVALGEYYHDESLTAALKSDLKDILLLYQVVPQIRCRGI